MRRAIHNLLSTIPPQFATNRVVASFFFCFYIYTYNNVYIYIINFFFHCVFLLSLSISIVYYYLFCFDTFNVILTALRKRFRVLKRCPCIIICIEKYRYLYIIIYRYSKSSLYTYTNCSLLYILWKRYLGFGLTLYIYILISLIKFRHKNRYVYIMYSRIHTYMTCVYVCVYKIYYGNNLIKPKGNRASVSPGPQRFVSIPSIESF